MDRIQPSETAVRRCIYCLEEKSDDAFNREHVIPEAFGVFENNLVLTCVCKDCNDKFSKDLDLKLSRDTLEGFERYRRGLKDPTEFKHIGRRSTTRVEVQEGPMKGVMFWPKPPHEGVMLSDDEMPPQVLFARKPEGPFKRYLLDQLPSKDELRAQGFEPGVPLFVRIWGTSLENAWARLEAMGFSRGEMGQITMPERGRPYTEWVFTISHPEFRAATKIAMNYLAAVTSPGIATLPQFNGARRYVTNGVRPKTPPVLAVTGAGPALERSSGRPVDGHLLSIEKRGDEVVAQVVLFSAVRYIVRLTDVPFAVDFGIQFAHFFDVSTWRVGPVNPPPWPLAS